MRSSVFFVLTKSPDHALKRIAMMAYSIHVRIAMVLADHVFRLRLGDQAYEFRKTE